MRISLVLLFVGIFIFFSSAVVAQQFGAFPPTIRWKQINSDTTRIIFQEQVRPHAERIAAIIHRMAQDNPNPLGKRVRKINTILHSNTTLANGYVALAPFRSEYYLIPSSDIFSMGANPWQDELAVHEYRHVLQNSNLRQGLSRVASFILGEEGQALFNALAVPDWFYEGDAVHSETASTPQGRGRTPYFFNGFNSLFRENKNYNWMKLRNGSLRDYVPNHYQLGYLLVNYGYLKYGHDFWGKVTTDAAAYKSLIYPLQGAIRRNTGVDYKTFRSDALNFYRQQLSKEAATLPKASVVTQYYFPQFINADSLVYLKRSYNKIPAFYICDATGEHKLKQQNISGEEWFSYRNGKIIYTAYDVDPRWTLRDYSNIITLDVHTGEERKITSRSRYFNPDISADGNRVIAVFVNDSANTEIHLLDADGVVQKKWSAANHGYFLHTRFVDESTVVYAERLANSTMSLNMLNIETGAQQVVIGPTEATVGHPYVQDGKIYFNASLKGRDEIYIYHLDDKSVQQLSIGGNGQYYPAFANGKLAWSAFTTSGMLLQQAPITGFKSNPITAADWGRRTVPFEVAGDDTTTNILSTPAKNYKVESYSSESHLFNFHSWRPYFSDPEYTFSLFSDNVLSNFTNELFYRYNQNESSHAVGFSSYYGGLYPVLTAGVTYTVDRTVRTTRRILTLNEFEVRGGYSIPLNFTGGKTYKSTLFGTNLVHNQLNVTGPYKDSFSTIKTNYLHHFINWSQQLPRAAQQIYPKLGYAVSLAHRHLLGESGFQFLGATRLFLPSFGNHSIVAAANWQETDTANVVFSDRFTNSRGYTDHYLSRMWRLSGNYHMPLVYPDWGFGNLVYFLRVRSNFFYDFSRVYSKDKLQTMDQRSVGAEIYFDSKWWNQLPVTFGFRLSHLLDRDLGGRSAGSNVFEVILPVDLIPR